MNFPPDFLALEVEVGTGVVVVAVAVRKGTVEVKVTPYNPLSVTEFVGGR